MENKALIPANYPYHPNAVRNLIDFSNKSQQKINNRWNELFVIAAHSKGIKGDITKILNTIYGNEKTILINTANEQSQRDTEYIFLAKERDAGISWYEELAHATEIKNSVLRDEYNKKFIPLGLLSVEEAKKVIESAKLDIKYKIHSVTQISLNLKL